MMVAFLAINLFMSRNNAPVETRSSDVILSQMRDQNAKELDQSIPENRRALDSKVSAEVNAKTITQAEADTKKFEGALLVADAQLRAGLHRDELNRMDASYQTLLSLWKGNHDTPMWDQLTFPEQGRVLQANDLFERSKDALNKANQKDQLYGFIPAYKVIDTLVKMTGSIPSISYALAALILAIFVRALIFPLSQKQLMWGRQMSQLAPLTKEIKEKYKDPSEQGLKTMELYKEYGINPYAGCLPALVQLPLFLTVYRCMLHYRFQFSAGTFLWINPGTAAALKGLGFFAPAANLGLEDHFLIVLYGISMVISTMLTPVSDPNNMKQQRLMGVGMSLMFAGMMLFGLFPVPAAFVLYWTFTNILATAQSLRAYRLPMPPLVKVNAATGGVYPVKKAKPGWQDIMREAMEKKMMESQKLAPATEEAKKDDIEPYKPPSNGKLPVSPNGKPSGKSATHKPKKRK